MLTEYSQLGVPTLRLLAEGPTVAILRELTDGPLRPSELRQRLPDVAHSALMRRLAELALKGAVAHERVAGLPTRAYYSLAETGRALLDIHEAAERWERQWSSQRPSDPPSQTPPDAPGTSALRLLADERARAIMRALADTPLRPVELELLPGLGRSATRRRLGRLLRDGILTRREDEGQVRYALTAAARRLEPVAMLAAQWEWQWASSGPGVTRDPRRPSPSGPMNRAIPVTAARPAPGG